MTAPGGDWLFDLGNSRLKLAPWRGGADVGPVDALASTGDGWMGRLPGGRTAWVCSVASPARTAALLGALAAGFDRVSVARTPRVFGGVRVAYAEPAQLGTDRFLAMLGARGVGAGPWLVVGVGTALTLDLLGAEGMHAGGRIAPSPTLMREALHARAAHLPLSGGRVVDFAGNTLDALASGCEGAAQALVLQAIASARAQLGQAVVPLLHGGGAEHLAAGIPGARLAPALVLQGLAAWARGVSPRG